MFSNSPYRLKSEMADIIGVSQSEHKSTVTKKSKSEKSHLTNDGSIKDRMRLLCVVTSDFLQFLTRYLFLSPSSFTSGFDLLSIFDTVFHLVVLEEHNTEGDINTKSSSLQLRQLTNSIGDDAMDDDSSSVTLLSELALMESCLDLLKEATVAQLCRWIPSQEDTARLFGNVLVSSTWQSFLQKSYLRKLLLLSTQLNKSKHHSPEVSVIESRISSKALDILRTLFDQFELVPVPNQAGYTFRYEFDAWVAAIGHHDDLLCVADLLIRLTATFHQSIQIKSFEMLSRPEMNASGSSEMVSSDSSMTLSPLISCCILLTCGDLEIFSEYLPSSIRAQYLDSDSVDESLVSRYSDGIGGVFQRLLVAVTAATTLFSGGVVDSLTLTSTIVRAISSKPDCNKLLASSPSIDHLSSELKNFLRLSINPQEGSESKDTFNYLENVLENNSVSIVNTWVQDKTKKRKVDDKPKAITMEVADDLSYIGLVSLSKELVIKSFHQLWDLQSLRGNLHLHNHFNSLSITSELHAVLLTVTLAIHRNSLGISRLEFIFSELKELLCHNTDRLHVSILTTLTKLWYVFKSQKFDISASQKPKKRTRTRSGGDLSYDDSTQQSSDTTDTLSGIIQFLETVMLNITDTSDSMEYMYASFQDQHFSDLSLTTDGSSSINSDFCSLFLDRFMKYYTTSTSQTLKSEMKILLVSLSENLVKRSVDGVWTDQMLRIGWQLQEVTQNSHLGKIVIQVLSSRPDSFKALSHQPSNLATNLFASGTPCSYSVNTSSANDIDVLSTAHSTNLSYGIITVGPFTTAILKNCPIENLLRMKAEFDMITADKNNFISSGCCVTVAPTSNDFSASISAWTDISSFLNPFDEYYSTGVNGSYNQSYLMPHQLRVVANHPSDYVAVAEFSTVYKLYQTWRVRISEMTRPTHDLVSTIYKDSPLLQSAFNSLLNSSFVESNLKGLSMALNLLLEQSANKDTMESIFLNMMCPILVKTVHESIVVASRDNQSVTKESNVMTVKSLWVAFYCRFVEHICDLLNSQLLAFYPQSDSLIAPSCDISSINTCYKLWTLTLHTLKDSDTLIVGVFNDNKVQKKLIKAIKTSLKLGIEEPTVLEGLTTVLRQVYDLCLNSNSSNLEGLLSVEISDFYHPAVLFQMTVCHSKFFDSLRNRQSNNSLLLFVLSLLSHVTKTDLDRLGEDCKSFVDTALAMKKYLVSSYRGTMSLTDRISLRILHTLAALNAIEDVYKIQLEVTSSLKQPSEEASAGAARFNLLPCSWLIQAVKQSIMYTTLSDFPTDRCVSPPPMKIESTSASDSYQGKLIETYRSLGRAYSLHPDENMVDEEPVDDSDTDQEDTKMDEDYTVEVNLKLLKQLGVTLSDEQNQAHNAMSVYDPAYWLPVILYRLQVTSNISLRLFCNSGLLALTIAAVGSESLPTRVIALAILHILLCRLNMQTLAHDPSFRARSQIVLLLRFIKNSIERTEQNNVDEDGLQQVQNEINLDSHIVCKVPSFPRSTILFMALSAMHLMQPGHELYGKVNKYLLSRPFCDTKDVPLFDLLVMEGDSTTSVISQQRVEVLRMIRDTLNDRLDHLNLCRKNAYSRLMGMYSIYSQDHKVGNTILDILEKGLSLRDSSRYLVQRCNIASWIHQLGAPNTDENVSSALALDKGNEAEYIVKNKHTGRSKLLHRRMKFMRRLVNACYLLYTEGLISVLEIRHLFTTMTCIVDESLDFYSQHEHTSEQTHFDFEYLSLVVLVMWEMTMLIRCVFIDDAVVKGDLQWKFTYIETFSQILIKMSDDGIDGASELLVTVLLIGSLLGFPDNDTQRRSFMNLSSHALLGRLGIPLHKETTVLGIYPLAQSNIQPSLIVNASDDKSSKVGAVNGYLFLAADVYSSVSDFGKYHSLEAQFSATWREFSVLDLNKCVFQSAGMDTRLLSTLLLSVCLRGITNPSPNTGDGGSVGRDANMSQLRLCLLLYSNFYRQNYLHNSKLMGLGKFRLLSISDSNPLNEYDIDFVKFQLMFRICCLSLLTLLPILPENIALDRVKLCLLKTLTYIMQGNSCSDVSRFISSQQLLQLINVPLTERSFDGLNLWKAMKGGTKMHSDTTMITMYAMQLVSTIVTGLDSTSGLAEICRAEGPTNCVNNLNVLLQGNISNLKKHTNESDEDMDLTSILSSIFT